MIRGLPLRLADDMASALWSGLTLKAYSQMTNEMLKQLTHKLDFNAINSIYNNLYLSNLNNEYY
jgi:hypothetical protein